MGKWGDLARALREMPPTDEAELPEKSTGRDAIGSNGTNGTPGAISRRECAGRQDRRAIGALGASDTPVLSPALVALRERLQSELDEAAAIHEFEGGLPREISEELVAIRTWNPPPWRAGQSRQARLEAASILADEWGAEALACGWPASELLGIGGPLDRLAGMRVVSIDEHGADARGDDGRYSRYNLR
ncbi:hypothetical protein RUR49_22900 [Pseudoxanthobacter sp. M-2]|uniref:hypothetical protein n=1 Tax=Pseudoxanthobacter sp. M-2 TaxID=3078754 RepID=UPI0038FBF170